MKRNRHLRADARQALKGHWGWAILVCIVFSLITSIAALPSAISSISNSLVSTRGSFFNPTMAATALGFSLFASMFSFVVGLFGSGPLSAGMCGSFNKFFSESDTNTIGNLFRLGFGGGRYWKNVWGIFLMNLFTLLWTLLFIVPGIIKAFAYAMTPYILIDNPELGPNEARQRSIQMMRGHKWKLFGLELSFIGWFMLCLLSLGVGFIWLNPYYRMAHAAFYRNLVDEFNAKNN